MRYLLITLLSIFSLSSYSQEQFTDLPLTKENVLLVCRHHQITDAKYVLAQAIQECGLKLGKHNNILGLTGKKGLYKFKHWSYSIEFYKKAVEYKKKHNEDHLVFLKRIRYAADKKYISKVQRIYQTL